MEALDEEYTAQKMPGRALAAEMSRSRERGEFEDQMNPQRSSGAAKRAAFRRGCAPRSPARQRDSVRDERVDHPAASRLHLRQPGYAPGGRVAAPGSERRRRE